MNNTLRVTLVSFLTYFVLSAMLAPIGIISGPMAEHFDKTITEVTRQFSWLTGGILVGSILALFIFDFFPLKRLIMVIYGIIALVLLSLFAIDSLSVSQYILGFVGLGSGIGLAGAAITISHSYQEARRASMLVMTDGCFSAAGFIVSWTAAWLIGQHYGWSVIYQLVGLVGVTIVLVSATASFPATSRTDASDMHVDRWPLSVWLAVASLFLYTLGQNAMLFWLPNYAITQLSAPAGQAGALVGQFWLGMFIAQLFVSWWVLKIGVNRLVMIASLTTFISSIPLWVVRDMDMLMVLALLWGFGNLAMLKATLSFATLQVSVPTPRLVSLLLLGATLGTAVSPLITSQIVEWTDNRTILIFSSGCYGVLMLLMQIAIRLPVIPRTSQPAFGS